MEKLLDEAFKLAHTDTWAKTVYSDIYDIWQKYPSNSYPKELYQCYQNLGPIYKKRFKTVILTVLGE